MKEIVEYTEDYKVAWSKYVADSNTSTIAHQIGWKEVMEEGLGHEPRYLLALEGEDIRGILPLAMVRTFWRSSYVVSLPWIDYGGICADDFETEKMLIDKACRIADGEKAQFLELRSIEKANHNLSIREDKATFLLRLDGDPEVVWKGFNAKLRNQIRKSEKSGLATEFGGIESLPDFYRIFAWKMHDLGTPVWGMKLFESILRHFPETAGIILVKRGEQAVAGGLLLSFKNRLYVPSAAAFRSALKFCPNHALYWEAIKKGCREDYEYFDFGRSALNSNTYRFKLQWVPEPTRLVWQYYLARLKDIPSINPSNPKYNLFINIWKRMPLKLANYLGPKVIRNFP
ncbi:MAG: FemAB family PEP-CTERM system-associated protein [Candidatus Zixiibacteriota bacterium]|nr:MAG: FemAB family PEP-CTERM system-associated protein [candidate division Zixibacteria bacterium]